MGLALLSCASPQNSTAPRTIPEEDSDSPPDTTSADILSADIARSTDVEGGADVDSVQALDATPPPPEDSASPEAETVDASEPAAPITLLPHRAARGTAWTFRLPGAPPISSLDVWREGAPDPTILLGESHVRQGDRWIPAEALENAPIGARSVRIETDEGVETHPFLIDLAEGEMTLAVGNGELGKTLDPTPVAKKELLFPVGLEYAENVLFYTDAGWNTIEAVAVGNEPLTLFNGTLTAPPGVALPIAGTGGPGDSIDGPSLEVALSEPKGLCHRRDGEARLLFFADTTHHQLRVLNLGDADVLEMGHLISPGHVVTLAGIPSYGYGGDGGDALEATFFRPWRVRGCEGNFLVTGDVENHRVRAVNRSAETLQLGEVLIPPGFVDTLAGVGTLGYTGDGGPATAAEVSIPKGFAITREDVLVFSDPENNAIRAVNLTGETRLFNGVSIAPGAIETAGPPGTGNGLASTPGYFHPTALRLDADDMLYSTDTYSQTIKLHNTRSGPVVRAGVTSFPGTVPFPLAGVEHFKGETLEDAKGLDTLMADPFDLTLDEARGDLYVTDVENHVIRRLKIHAPRGMFDGAGGAFPELPENLATQPHVLNVDTGILTASDGNFHALGATSGVWSFTSLHLPESVHLSIEGTRPAVFLVTGPVTITGSIRVSAGALAAGPGIGTGQGGGGHSSAGAIAGAGTPGNPYGSLKLTPLTAGSAGGGALGGGALLLASQQSLTVHGMIDARGQDSQIGGAGSGGGIRLVSGGDLTLKSTSQLDASGGVHAGGQGHGANGRIRLEAVGTLAMDGDISPAASTSHPDALTSLELPGI